MLPSSYPSLPAIILSKVVLPVPFFADLSKASVADLHYMKDVKHTYHDCSIYGYKGYIGADVQLDLFETAHIRLECPYQLNQKDWKPTFIPFAKARKRIETIFSQLTEQFIGR